MKLSSNQIGQIFTWARQYLPPEPAAPIRLDICVEECYDDDRANFTVHIPASAERKIA